MLRTFRPDGRPLRAIPLSLLCIAALLALALCWRQITPYRPVGHYATDHTPKAPLNLPLIGLSGVKTVSVEVKLELKPVHPTRWRIRVDDCLTAFVVNGRTPTELKTPLCPYPNEIELELEPYLHGGINQITAHVLNRLGPLEFEIRPAPRDPLIRFFHLFAAGIIGLVCLATWDAWGGRGPRDRPSLLAAVFAVGVLLQVGYFWQTPAWLRSNDYMGHVGYLRFMLENWSIPRAAEGWQTYQPPFYYLLCALWLRAAAALGLSGITITGDAQLFSLFLTIGFFILALRILQLIYGKPERREQLVCSTALVACAPCVFMSSARISNDLLVQLLMLAALHRIVCMHNSGRLRDLLLSFGFIGLGALTKTNALLLAPATLVVIAARGFRTPKQTFKRAAYGLCLLGLVYAWYPAFRSGETGQLHPVGNLSENPPGLFLQDSIGSYVVFNPVKVLEQPYVNNWDDSARRRFVWEYLFRSAFFGEFRLTDDKRWITVGILFFALQITALAFYRLAKALLKPADELFPFAIVIVFTLSAVAALRLIAHIGGLADFRYVYFSIVPFCAFAASAVCELRPTLRPIGRYLLGTLVFLTFVLACYLNFGLIDPPVKL